MFLVFSARCLLRLSMALAVVFCGASSSLAEVSSPSCDAPLVYQQFAWPSPKNSVATIHWLAVNSQRLRVAPVLSDSLSPVRSFRKDPKQIALMNGGYFDPVNQQSVSWFKLSGQPWVSPADNLRLTENKGLKPYWSKILNRSEWRVLDCKGKPQYQIAQHLDPLPANCTLTSALGAGPQLLPTLTHEAEAFTAKNKAGRRIRDAIGLDRRNARSAVGLRLNRQPVLVLVEQEGENGGMSLPELASWLEEHGVVSALNLDGGSSSSLWLKEEGTLLGKRVKGQPVERAVLTGLSIEYTD